MKHYLAILFLCLPLLALPGRAQTVDTLVDVGGYRLHFHIIKGKGTPILLEAGGGDDARVWEPLLRPLAQATGTTLITYDRAGFGKSEVSREADDTQHGILSGMQGLETGLKKLGYGKELLLVAHSYGGFYSSLYAARHPKQVKAVVLLDAMLPSFATDDFLAGMMRDMQTDIAKNKTEHRGRYFQTLNYPATVQAVRNAPFPASIPVIDVVAEQFFMPNPAEAARWKACHQQFVAAQPNRESLTAYGCGHYLFHENPALAVSAIAKAHAATRGPQQSADLLQRSLRYSVEATNELKKRETDYRHSESDLNSWGYTLLRQGETQKALEIFKLNTVLHPQSGNAFDSLAEAYLTSGNKELAKANYKRSVELNPKNTNAVEVLKTL
ncbi:alpha/beta fold hydrolase [Hymenobacter sp. HSC-4F20]|uniref:alpha/beta fold hydrolase n=1 Tax=Hymenobacter sp. HSC-4F20 TaxID=2864135 RepID=UPI001C737A3C|nr:alpha/beta fold hydrolase [Hymenobacter sp. HSC-4F20]MBX0289180.1 alpha/beta fold hydrolase [Hymenobacter sp. HSC-4F20]